MKRVYINNAEYNTFFNIDFVDSDKLCAVFIHLRGSKNGERRYKPQGKLKHFGLLVKETKLSRHAIETYTPILIKLGVVSLNKDGGVSVMGFDTSFKLLKTNETKKIYIPIQMQKSWLKTMIGVGYVRTKSNIKHQNKQIDIKETQKKLLKKYVYQTNNPTINILNRKEKSSAEKLVVRYGSVNEFLSTYCEETILSHNGFAKLNKSKDGRYFKKQLVDCGFIESKIRTEKLSNQISYKKYISLKSVFIDNSGKGIYWSPLDGCVHKYLPSSIKGLVGK